MNNPKMFWKEIGKLCIGKDRRQIIPMEVLLPDGVLSIKDEDVLRVWKNGFSSLLNAKKSRNEDIQPLGNDVHSTEHASFNEPITLSELFKAVNTEKGTKCVVSMKYLMKLIYFYTATKEISCILLTMTIKLMLSRLLIRLLGTSMTF